MFPGTWWAGQTAGLLLLAFLMGWGLYAFTFRGGKLRACRTYIGGERLDEARIPGVPLGPERHVEVTGVDFDPDRHGAGAISGDAVEAEGLEFAVISRIELGR